MNLSDTMKAAIEWLANPRSGNRDPSSTTTQALLRRKVIEVNRDPDARGHGYKFTDDGIRDEAVRECIARGERKAGIRIREQNHAYGMVNS